MKTITPYFDAYEQKRLNPTPVVKNQVGYRGIVTYDPSIIYAPYIPLNLGVSFRGVGPL